MFIAPQSLICRLLGWMGEGDQERLVVTVLQNMTLLARKDAHDQQLALLWPATDRLVASAAPPRLLELAAAFTNNSSSSSVASPQRNNLSAALYNKVRNVFLCVCVWWGGMYIYFFLLLFQLSPFSLIASHYVFIFHFTLL